MTKSYYYINYTITPEYDTRPCKTCCVTDKHPFEWLKFFDLFSGKWQLVDWKEITEAEYNNGKPVVGIG